MIFGKHINKYYLRYAPWLLVGLFTLYFVDYIQLLIPNLYQMVINGVNNGFVVIDGVKTAFDTDLLLDRICLPMIGVIIGMVIGRFLWRITIYGAGVRMECRVRNEMFSVVKELSRPYFHKNNVGDIMSRFTNDLETVHECFSDGFIMLFDALILGTMAIIKMVNMNPVLALLSLIPIAIMIAISAVVGKFMMDRWELRQKKFSELSDFAQENFSGITVVKAFVKESKELWAFKALNRENEEANVSFTRLSVLMRVLVMLFVESVTCIILGYGGYLVYSGVFNAGQLMEYIGYFNTIVWPAMAVSELIDLTARGRASLSRVSELLDSRPEVFDRPDVTDLGDVRGEIEFRSLTFRYPGQDSDKLKDVSFRIEAGESVGIVGRTGTGKTTVVDLLLRLYNVPDGTVFIDGHDVNSVPIRQVRDACAYVPQDNFLFSDTVANNIAFCRDDVKDTDTIMDDIVEAGVLADIDDNVRDFTDGYHTVLGERGVTVSGGQKQRISIARALMKNAPILILDDSVSAVDTGTERKILSNLEKSRGGRTTLVIAHRISTVERLDKIIFIGEGGVIEAVGTHAGLYSSCPEYRKMVDLQKLEEEGAAVNA